jgi:hypothetical protein
MQSAKERERRPVALNKRAALSASREVRISDSGKNFRADASWAGKSGPHKNSAQTMLLIPTFSLGVDHQARTWACSVEVCFKALIK